MTINVLLTYLLIPKSADATCTGWSARRVNSIVRIIRVADTRIATDKVTSMTSATSSLAEFTRSPAVTGEPVNNPSARVSMWMVKRLLDSGQTDQMSTVTANSQSIRRDVRGSATNARSVTYHVGEIALLTDTVKQITIYVKCCADTLRLLRCIFTAFL